MQEIIQVGAFEDEVFPNVAVKSNVASVKSEIFRLTPPLGIFYMVDPLNFYIIGCKLNKSGGDQSDRMGKLWLMVKTAGQETLEELTEFDYAQWVDLSIAQQQNINFKENSKVQFPLGRLPKDYRVLPGDMLVLELRSSDVVSWAATDGTQIFFKVIKGRVEV